MSITSTATLLPARAYSARAYSTRVFSNHEVVSFGSKSPIEPMICLSNLAGNRGWLGNKQQDPTLGGTLI